MTEDMVTRVPPADPIDSIMEQPALGHGVTQNFGAEVADSTNAVRPHTDGGAPPQGQQHGHPISIRSPTPTPSSNPFTPPPSH